MDDFRQLFPDPSNYQKSLDPTQKWGPVWMVDAGNEYAGHLKPHSHPNAELKFCHCLKVSEL